MHPTPTTSVLIPVYNREDLVSDSIRSALEQTVRDLEVVVVDNASTDGTWAVCRRFAREDPRVRVFRNPTNLGPVRNWKRCFEEARGRYGKVLFSDDTMAPRYLERALPMLEDPEVGFVFSSIALGPEPGRVDVTYWWKRSTAVYPSEAFIQAAMCGINVPVSPGAALFRMDALRKNLVLDIPSPTGIDFTRHGAGPDVLLLLLTAREYPRIGYVAAPLSFFRSHGDSITARESTEVTLHHFLAKLWFAGSASPGGGPPDADDLPLCLAGGWLRHVRKRRELLPTKAYSARFVDPPRRIPLGAILRVWWRQQRERRIRKRDARRVPVLE